MRMSIEDAKRAVRAVVGDMDALDRALDDLVQAVREDSAGIARSFEDPNPLASIFRPWIGYEIADAVQKGEAA